jgi:hypothetical protein
MRGPIDEPGFGCTCFFELRQLIKHSAVLRELWRVSTAIKRKARVENIQPAHLLDREMGSEAIPQLEIALRVPSLNSSSRSWRSQWSCRCRIFSTAYEGAEGVLPIDRTVVTKASGSRSVRLATSNLTWRLRKPLCQSLRLMHLRDGKVESACRNLRTAKFDSMQNQAT